ncbi:MAG: hypothetical protein P4L10_07750 [Acidobacteriaceae bacterium]|nr:hypothetical protein [Acidobacteriaceae bacterium]
MKASAQNIHRRGADLFGMFRNTAQLLDADEGGQKGLWAERGHELFPDEGRSMYKWALDASLPHNPPITNVSQPMAEFVVRLCQRRS